MKYFQLATGRVRCRIVVKQSYTGITTILLILMLSICLLANAQAKVQSSFTIQLEKVPIEKVFKAIEKQSRYRFMFYAKILEHAIPVTITVKDVSLQTVLQIAFAGQPFTYEVKNQLIMVLPAESTQKQAPPVQNTIQDTIITVTGQV